MDIRKLQRAIVDGLEDVKAQNVVVFNTEHGRAAHPEHVVHGLNPHDLTGGSYQRNLPQIPGQRRAHQG